jgi:hypothetical protein
MIVLGVTNPVGKPISESRRMCYNAVTDILWCYADVGDHNGVVMKWAWHTSNASKYHPELAAYRTRVTKELR